MGKDGEAENFRDFMESWGSSGGIPLFSFLLPGAMR